MTSTHMISLELVVTKKALMRVILK